MSEVAQHYHSATSLACWTSPTAEYWQYIIPTSRCINATRSVYLHVIFYTCAMGMSVSLVCLPVHTRGEIHVSMIDANDELS